MSFSYGAWYKGNRVAVNKRRREKYQQDQAFRQQQIERAREYRSENRSEDPPEGRWTKGLAVVEVRRHRTKLFVVGGKDVLCSWMGTLLERIRIAESTLAAWETKGVIPVPTVVDNAGRRWYSAEYVRILESCVTTGRREGWSTDHLKEEVWKAYGRIAGGRHDR